MSLYSGLTCKGFGDDPHVEVTASDGRAGMPGMEMGLVLDEKISRRKGLFQTFADTSDTLCGHGNTLRNGLTMTFS